MHHSSVSWEITLLHFFSWTFIWFVQKEPIKVQNFRLSTVQVKFHQIRTLLKVYKISANISIEELCLMILKSDTKFEEKLTCCFKNDKNLVNFVLSIRNSQNFHSDWFLLCKVYNVRPKKVRRSYFLWQWRLMQNLNKNWLVV